MKIAVYGSLRVGEYNYNYFKKYFGEGMKYITTDTVSGFKLYDLGSYPGIKVSDDPEDILVVDVLDCDERCFNRIDAMELGAGYEQININVKGDDCIMYLFKYPVREEKRVKSGNWSEYLEEKAYKKELHGIG